LPLKIVFSWRFVYGGKLNGSNECKFPISGIF
jgi:hypothetical protein